MNRKILASLKKTDIQTKAVFVTIIIGFILMAVLLFQIHEDRYSQVFIYPDTIKYYKESNSSSFKYGITSFEKSDTDYNVAFYLNEELIDKKNVQLHPGESYEEFKSLNLLGKNIEGKVRILVRTPHNDYEVYYWLK